MSWRIAVVGQGWLLQQLRDPEYTGTQSATPVHARSYSSALIA
ncbi:MAG TPA: hypothetical protein VHJ20_06725 [Polyangia bacterium]|nr:hypothetical protein [Polyangia bacterium]